MAVGLLALVTSCRDAKSVKENPPGAETSRIGPFAAIEPVLAKRCKDQHLVGSQPDEKPSKLDAEENPTLGIPIDNITSGVTCMDRETGVHVTVGTYFQSGHPEMAIIWDLSLTRGTSSGGIAEQLEVARDYLSPLLTPEQYRGLTDMWFRFEPRFEHRTFIVHGLIVELHDVNTDSFGVDVLPYSRPFVAWNAVDWDVAAGPRK